MCVCWAPRSLIVILFVTRWSKCVRGMRRNVCSDTHTHTKNTQWGDDRTEGWERQNDSQRYWRREEVRSQAALRTSKKRGRFSHSLPLTRVLTECWCVTIDQILLLCEHFYSLEEQRPTGRINCTSSQALCVCLRVRVSVSVCVPPSDTFLLFCVSLILLILPLFIHHWAPFGFTVPEGSPTLQSEGNGGWNGGPWARADTTYQCVCLCVSG